MYINYFLVEIKKKLYVTNRNGKNYKCTYNIHIIMNVFL